ncbi:MAG: fumarate reductase subunit C [Acidobacteria bacterium]|nr:fumarate reductase subunit C [Acidobacteriota bacterium]
MSEGHVYTAYHPRWLRQRISTYWWLEKPAYLAFILREASCVFVAWFVVYLLLLVDAVSGGAAAYAQFLAWSADAPILLLNVVSFLFVVFHAVTFFDAAPQAMVVHVGQTRVPGHLVLAGHYAAWAAVSVFVAWLLASGQ